MRCWAGRYRNQWLVVRVGDRRILTTGTLDHCLTWVRIYASTGRALVPGSPLSYNCPL